MWKLHIGKSRKKVPGKEDTMATNLNLDDGLVEEARKMGKHKTKLAAVTAALEEYIRYQKQLGIRDLFGTIEYEEDYDYKALRSRARKK
jgi:hypothetical protein